MNRRANLQAAIPLLLVVIVVSGAAALGWRGAFQFAFGNGLERMYTVGFYSVEPTSDGSSGAWTADGAVVRLPWSEWAGAKRLLIHMAAPRNPGQPPPTVYLNIDGTPLATLHPAPQMQDYDIDLSNRPVAFSDANLFINSETFSPGQGKGDNRNLGVFISAVRLEPSAWFVLLRALLVGLMAGGLYWLARRIVQHGKLGEAAGLAVGLGLGLLTVGGLTWMRADLAPYIHGWAVAAVGAALLVRAADALVARLGGGPLVPLTYAALLFPLPAAVQAVWARLQLATLQDAVVLPAVTILLAAPIAGVALFLAYRRWRDNAAQLRRACLTIFLIVAVLYFVSSFVLVFTANMYRGNDLRQDYAALQQWQVGGLPYSLTDALDHPGTAVKLPPIFAYTMLPQMWAGQTFQELLLGWRLGNALLYLLAVWLTLRAFDIRLRSEAGGAAVWLALCSNQAVETLAWGQFNIIMLVSIAAALWLIRKGRLFWAGAAMALAVMLKFFPATMALPFAMRPRRWGGLGGLATGFIALALLPIPLLGWDSVYYYWTKIFPNLGGGADEGVANQSLYGMVARLAVTEANLQHRPPGAWWVLPIVIVAGLLLTLITIWLIYRQSHLALPAEHDTPLARLLPYLLALALGLLISPFSWAHYDTVLLPASVGLLLLTAARYDVQRSNSSRTNLSPTLPLLFAITFVMIGYGGRFDLAGDYAAGLDRVGVSYHGLTLILLWLLLAWMLWTWPAAPAPARDTSPPAIDDLAPAMLPPAAG